ncbi:chemotaxis protein CheX [Deefgea salmonis]|uniref:Chemotaxis protein CheX n=1 Tax=Deefgea salmonis TaxID=2875502 RepID=A0ABS8BLX0_9NEIS|nr:chemotaxis protein CheX [Deefgea salmonis]MCB5196706.1 chemotaxis protein CheX [Deefgea salmonis]
MLELGSLQRDALCEIFNISVGQAAASMSQIINEEILLSVPMVEFYSVEEAAAYLEQSSQRVCSVRQSFDGSFHGNALLIFPEARSLDLVRLMMGNSLPIEQLTELEQDALSEIGNIILNSCLGSLADIFKQPFQCGLPALHIGSGISVLKECDANHVVMVLQIQFSLAARELHGHVIFIMNANSLELLNEAINRFLGALMVQS